MNIAFLLLLTGQARFVYDHPANTILPESPGTDSFSIKKEVPFERAKKEPIADGFARKYKTDSYNMVMGKEVSDLA